MPTHNGAENYRMIPAIKSVLDQTFGDFEFIIVCDACDNDSTFRLAMSYATDPRVKVIETTCGRDGLARNAGLDIATGKWILFIDDDDWFLHEYCFEKLAEQLRNTNRDILDFSFVWKGRGYKDPTPDEQFVMAWCRAWNRDFIGGNRFNDQPYGSDKEFYERMIKNDKDLTVSFWHFPMYYYNYMREGSLSYAEHQKSQVDIIVVHNDEPPYDLYRFFNSLKYQRIVDQKDIHVIVVQNGDTYLYMPEKLAEFEFRSTLITIPASDIFSARNAGLVNSAAEWVMFCDLDEMLGDFMSMSSILETLPTSDYDIIWMKSVHERPFVTGEIYPQKVDQADFTTTSGKLYRRSLLEDKFINFQSDSVHGEYVFNALVLSEVPPHRIAMLTTDFYPYLRTYNRESEEHQDTTFVTRIMSWLRAEQKLMDTFFTRGKGKEYQRHLAKFLYRWYYSVHTADDVIATDAPKDVFKYVMTCTNMNIFHDMPEADRESICEETEAEMMNFIQQCYNECKIELYFVNEDMTFEDFLGKKMYEYGLAQGSDAVQFPDVPTLDITSLRDKEQVTIPAVEPDHEWSFEDLDGNNIKYPKKHPHVAVYCGTRNVYEDMLTSAKSLLAHTPMDEIYFFIEDDVFPYILPEQIQCIKISDGAKAIFDEHGPNFHNTWTYMCMVRAMFPELNSLCMYDRILSLDIDTIVTTDISELWEIGIDDYYLAGVPEKQRQKSHLDPMYINFGVVMMNLRKLREDHKAQEIIDLLNKQKLDCPEQTAYNRVCAGHILELPAKFNFTPYSHITGDSTTQSIIHYAGQKFWKHHKTVRKYAELSVAEVNERQVKLHASDKA